MNSIPWPVWRRLARPAAVAGGTTLLYLIFLGHRTDYAGHYIAGFGAACFLTAFGLWWRPLRPAGKAALAGALLLIAIGLMTENTLFKIAQFDGVDVANQSLGACLAGICLLREEDRPGLRSRMTVFTVVLILGGFLIAWQ